jgi:hypothetical protein
MEQSTSSKQSSPAQCRRSLKNFEVGCLEVFPIESNSVEGEAVLTAAVTLAHDSDYFEKIGPWIHERNEIPEGPMPEISMDDLVAMVRTLSERGYKHLVIQSTGAQRLETLITNALAKYLDISSGELSVTRLMHRKDTVAFTTWEKQTAGEPLCV